MAPEPADLVVDDLERSSPESPVVVALEGGFVVKPKNGRYAVADPETGEIKGKDMKESDIESNSEIWKALLSDERFTNFIRSKYKLATNNLIKEDDE